MSRGCQGHGMGTTSDRERCAGQRRPWVKAGSGQGVWGAQQGLTGLQKTNIRMRLVSKPPLAAVWGWPGSHIRARDSGGNPPQRGSLCRRPPAHGQC